MSSTPHDIILNQNITLTLLISIHSQPLTTAHALPYPHHLMSPTHAFDDASNTTKPNLVNNLCNPPSRPLDHPMLTQHPLPAHAMDVLAHAQPTCTSKQPATPLSPSMSLSTTCHH